MITFAVFQALSNIDHVTPIPFGHFAITLTSWYRQHLHLCRRDLRKAIMTSWYTWRFPVQFGQRSATLFFFHNATVKFNIFSLNLTGDSDFLILFISTQNKLSNSGFSKIGIIRFFAVVNYMAWKFSFCSNFYVDVSQTFTFNTVLSIWYFIKHNPEEKIFHSDWYFYISQEISHKAYHC